MCCPCFDPVEPRAGSGSQHARLPLGDFWSGVCRAGSEPEDAALPCCNLGYARGNCSRFPENQDLDAVRFGVAAEDAAAVRIRYIIERQHHPFAHGWLEYSLEAKAFAHSPADEILHRQARAYLTSYLRRKVEASGH